ncbi:MAG: hypothetical protein QOE74_468, partial [Mycobacterium sp.]|nr:hypothetical protein [Mycobacterium sp.]
MPKSDQPLGLPERDAGAAQHVREERVLAG